MNSFERRQRILEVLSIKRKENIKNLATRFGVTPRTIKNDIVALSLTAPIYTVSGNGGGVFLDSDWKVRSYLTTPQRELLEDYMYRDIPPEEKQILQGILDTFSLPSFAL